MHIPEGTSRFVDVSSDLLARGHRVRFRASGGSMRPAICDGDLITVEPAAAAELTPGSVAIYRHLDRLFAHRVVRVEGERSAAPRFVLRGDATRACDAPVSAAQILGEVVSVRRGPERRPGGVSMVLGGLLGVCAVPARRMWELVTC
jgi:SOS-response transcriptional repressor LexA